MGYYLNIDKPDLGSDGVCLGGKFFGYLYDGDFKGCRSYKFLKTILDDNVELLNVWWSCYSFTLKLEDAITFLNLYSEDYERLKGQVAFGVDAVIPVLYSLDPEAVRFAMG